MYRGEWESGRAPPLDQVRADVAAAVRGCTVVGHGLTNDLRKLGLDHPRWTSSEPLLPPHITTTTALHARTNVRAFVGRSTCHADRAKKLCRNRQHVTVSQAVLLTNICG